MKIRITKLLAVLFIGIGLYGTLAVGIFFKRYGMSTPTMDPKQYNEQFIRPTIEKRIAELDKSQTAETAYQAYRRIIVWQATDYDISMNLAMRGHIMLLGLLVSLFSILAGILSLIWDRQTRIQNEINMMTQQGVAPYVAQGAPSGER